MTFDIKNMLSPEVYDHPVTNIELIETHISWVILTGEFVYKIKKPVNFGFLDFSTLEKRHRCCINELRLNSRLAADIYLEVVAISGTREKPVIAGGDEVFEYAVKMAQFPQSAQLDHMLAAGKLKLEHMYAIARMVADFHQKIEVADGSVDYGNADAVYQPVEENFSQIRDHLDTTPYASTLQTLEAWSRATFDQQQAVFEQRKRDGFVRECHGDMHLRNLVWLDSGPAAFDCIEFNAHLRWIDIVSDVAFLVMDLQARQQQKLANRVLNSYLEITGDYAALCVLPFYLCYRALVRAKVDALRIEQKSITEEERQAALAEFESYLRLATIYTQAPAAKLIIMRGMSASGKSTISQQLVDAGGMIRIRSDVERKRLFSVGLADNAVSASKTNEINGDIYSAQASQQTYRKLLGLASEVISAGYSVIVDAAFLKYQQRELFEQLAQHLAVTYIILEITAPAEVLRQRIVERQCDVSDADLAVLDYQLTHWQALKADESSHVITVNSATTVKIDALVNEINAR